MTGCHLGNILAFSLKSGHVHLNNQYEYMTLLTLHHWLMVDFLSPEFMEFFDIGPQMFVENNPS